MACVSKQVVSLKSVLLLKKVYNFLHIFSLYFLNYFLIFDIFALFFMCPTMPYVRFCPKCLEKNLMKTSNFVKSPNQMLCFFLCVKELSQTTWRPLPSPLLNLKSKFSSGHMMFLLRRVESRSAQMQTCQASPQVLYAA